ncbi:MAG: M24 family metallopeptidase [Syntrophobacteraceae bacterium]
MTTASDPYVNRLERFRAVLRERGLDAFLVLVPENRFYLSGFEAEDLLLTESSGCLLITGSRQFLLTDSRYEEEGKAEAQGFDVVIYREGLAATLTELFHGLETERLGVESHYATYALFRGIEKALKAARPSAVAEPVEDLIEEMRLVKDSDEIERIRRSLALSERVLEAVWESITPWRKERDVAWEIERRIREGGAEAVSFPPIVAGGPNGALPHAVPGDRAFQPGDAVVVDMGSKMNLYCSDITRTRIVGEPDARLRTIYRVVREAQLAAQATARAGVATDVVDAAARDLIERAGYGNCFDHGLGHGVGIAVHEGPRLSKRKPTVLRENMVVTIEPGIYIPGFQGVRLENMVRITANGCEVLNALDLFYRY